MLRRTQFELLSPAVSDNQPVRKKELDAALAGLQMDSAQVLLDSNFIGTYDPATMTLTAATGEPFIVDDITVVAGWRIGLKGQTDNTQNGVYVATEIYDGAGSPLTILTRASDFNEDGHLRNGKILPIIQGTDYAGQSVVLSFSSPAPWAIDTTGIIWTLDVPADEFSEHRFTIEPDGIMTSWTLNHGLNTRNVTVDIVDGAGNDVGLNISRPSLTTVTVSSAPYVFADTEILTVIVRGVATAP
jgi:hypothetical protein